MIQQFCIRLITSTGVYLCWVAVRFSQLHCMQCQIMGSQLVVNKQVFHLWNMAHNTPGNNCCCLCGANCLLHYHRCKQYHIFCAGFLFPNGVALVWESKHSHCTLQICWCHNIFPSTLVSCTIHIIGHLNHSMINYELTGNLLIFRKHLLLSNDQ